MNILDRNDFGLLVGVAGIALFVVVVFMALALLSGDHPHQTSNLQLPTVDITRGY